MSLSVPVVWTDRHRRHEPGGEIWVGVRTPGTEVGERAERIRAALEAAGAPIVEATEHDDEAVLAAHDRELLDYLASAWDEWRAAGLDADPGQDRVVPYVFTHPALMSGLRPAMATAITARAASQVPGPMRVIVS